MNEPMESNLKACLPISYLMGYLSDLGVAVVEINLSNKTAKIMNDCYGKIFSGAGCVDPFQFILKLIGSNEKKGTKLDLSERQIVWENQLLSFRFFQTQPDVYILFLQDETEFLRLESIAEAVNLSDNIGHIFSEIRHEIGNPINTIKMTMSVLRRNLEYLPKEKISDYVDRCLGEIVRLEELLHSLKNYSMFDRPKPHNVNISDFMDKFLSLVEGDFCAQGVVIRMFSQGDIWGFVDPRGLQQILLNVFKNALDALNGIENPELVITVVSLMGRLIIKVRDNGIGISPAQQASLFKPFYTTKEKGTGLGLVISRKILHNMNGSIKIQSIERNGTSVVISLPSGSQDEEK